MMISEMRKARILRGLTLDDLWLKTGINISKLSRLERSIFKPTDDERIRIAKALKVAPDNIFSRI